MAQLPPIIPDYGRAFYPPPRPPSGHPVLAAFLGIFLGAAISTIIYVPLWNIMNTQLPTAPFLIACIKLVVAIVLIATSARFRFVGIGLLISIGLGTLIFMGSLVAHC